MNMLAAVHESGCGTFETYQPAQKLCGAAATRIGIFWRHCIWR